MTYEGDITLTLANTWYNLYSAIIAAEIAANASFDQNFGNSPYIPSMAMELMLQSDMINNAGMYITTSNKRHRGGTLLAAGSADLIRSGANTISVRDKELKSDTAGAIVHVRIEA